jgi:hypothetical protein
MIVFRRSGIVKKNCPFGALELGSREEKSIVSAERTNLSMERKFFLSFREWIRGFHTLLKENL